MEVVGAQHCERTKITLNGSRVQSASRAGCPKTSHRGALTLLSYSYSRNRPCQRKSLTPLSRSSPFPSEPRARAKMPL